AQGAARRSGGGGPGGRRRSARLGGEGDEDAAARGEGVSDDDLVQLVAVESPVELAGLRAMLEGHGIRHVVQGNPEAQASIFSGAFDPLTAPRILVAKKDLEEATALLEAKPD